MLCACSGDQFKSTNVPQSPESLATRDFSASCLTSRNTGDSELNREDFDGEETECMLKEVITLNYEEARALLGRLEYQRGNYEAALQVFRGIDIASLVPKMVNAIVERTRRRNTRSKGQLVSPTVMSMHSVSLILEAILLKAKSLEELGHHIEAAKECTIVLDIMEAAMPNGLSEGIGERCKIEEMFHNALTLLPIFWTKAGVLEEAIGSSRRILVKPWGLESNKLVQLQKNLALMLLYGAVETRLPPHLHLWGRGTPHNNVEEAILLLLVLTDKVASGEINWDDEVMDHLTYALSVTGQFDLLTERVEQALPGVYSRTERWYLLALCCSAAGQNEAALNLLKKCSTIFESEHQLHIPSCLFGAKLCSQEPNDAHAGIDFAGKIADPGNDKSDHVMAQAYKYLGICYGNAARSSVFDAERGSLHKKSMNFLKLATISKMVDPEQVRSICVENIWQRDLENAFDNAMVYSGLVSKQSVDGLKILALVMSAQRSFNDAESIVELALDDAGRSEQLELLRFKAGLQIAQEQPKKAIETFRILLSLIQAKEFQFNELQDGLEWKTQEERNLELAVWQDLAAVYTQLGSWQNAKVCLEKAQLMDLHCPKTWHTSGQLFEAQANYKEALFAFAISLTIDPEYVPSLVSTARILMKFGDHSRPIARSFLMNAVRLESTNHEAWWNLGLISKMEGSLLQATDCFQAAYELQLSAPVDYNLH